MKKIKTVYSLISMFFFFRLFYSQTADEEESESNESIMARQEFINIRRAGGPDRKLPKNAL